MKIGFDGRFIRKGQTGNGMATQQLLQGLADIDNENEYVIYLLDDEHFIPQDNFSLKRMPSLHANSQMRFLFTFPVELFRNPVDIFHSIWTVPFIPYRTPTKIVLTLIEISWFVNPDNLPVSPLFLAQVRMTTRYSIWRANRIISPTNFVRDQMVDYLNLPEEKIEVIPFGVNENFLKPCSTEAAEKTKSKFGINAPYILSVGDLHPRKNQSRLIEAFNWLKETRNIPHQLVLVGKELYQAEEICGRASASSARDSIILTGYVTFDELRALYQGASVFAFPSLDEGFGLPVHEAMASRLPVVTSNRGALPEVAGNAAILVDPLDIEDIGSAILRIIDSPSLKEELVCRGLEQIKAFSWKDSCKKVLKLYNEIYSESNKRE